MKEAEEIKTYNAKTFNEKFMIKDPQVEHFFKSDFEHFFCLKIEDIGHLTKFPAPPLKSSSHAILFITSGIYKCKIGYQDYHIKKEEILVIAAGQIFSLYPIEKGTQGFICHFYQDILIGKYTNKDIMNNFEFLKIWGNPHINLKKGEEEFILNLINRLYIEYAENASADLDIIQPYLLALLSEINRNYNSKASLKCTAAENLNYKFKELIHAKAHVHNEVGYYAEILNVSPNHLNKSIKLATGKSPNKWINEIIITMSKYLLYQTSLSINEVSAQVGLLDPSYFSRLFKKHEGLSPIAYRKMIEKS